MNLSELIKRLARLFGYNLVRRPEHFMQDKSDGTQEGHLVALLAKLEVDLVLDVGANNGQYAKGIRRAGYAGPIISFEPAPEPFAKLRKASEKDPDWKAVQAALGSASGVGQLNLARASALNSFLAPNEYALTMKNWLKGEWETIETIDVPIRTLDEVLAESSASRVFLKMDTQGFDLEVLAGAGGSLDRIHGLQSEISVVQTYEKMPDYVDALGTYRHLGFQPTGLFPVWRRESLEVVEFDCIMRRVDNTPS